MRKIKLMFVIPILAAFVLAFPVDLIASDFPNQPVRLVVPYGPGGGTDTIARIISGVITENLNQPLIIVNRPGGTGTVGTADFKKMRSDGYSLLFNDAAAMSIKPQTDKLPYSKDDFRVVAQINEAYYILAVNADSPYKTINEFVDYAKENPGEINYASAGVGHIFHLAMEQAAKAADIKLTHIPFRGTGEAVTAALGGHVDAVVCYPNAILEPIRSGQLIPLAISSEKRQEILPDVPTFMESGVDYTGRGWKAIFAHKDIPEDRFEILQEAFLSLEESRSFQKLMTGLGETIALTPGSEFESFWLEEYKEYGDLLSTLGMKKQ